MIGRKKRAVQVYGSKTVTTMAIVTLSACPGAGRMPTFCEHTYSRDESFHKNSIMGVIIEN